MRKLLKSIGILILATISAVAYRAGGSGNFPRFFRPIGIGLCSLSVLWILFGFHWGIIFSSGAMAGLSTTYFKKKDHDAVWLNWLLVGLFLSLAVLPCIYFIPLLGFGIRTVVCTALITVWSQLIGNAVQEELGRGFIAVATLPLLLIG